jgi:hypothetical protein
VFFGRRTWPAQLRVEAEADVVIAGSRSGEGLDSGCDAGDFNGDGRVDLALVAREHTLWNMLGGRGRYFVFFGRDDWPRQLDAATDADVVIAGRGAGGRVTPPVLADVDGDGLQDLVAATGGGGETAEPSEVTMAFGRRLAPAGARGSAALPPDAVVRYRGDARLGDAIAAADLDRDGRDDLILADPDGGTLRVVMGRTQVRGSTSVATLQPVTLFSGARGAGESRIWIGDLDGDEVAEIAFGAPAHASDGLSRRGKAWFISPYVPIAIDVRPASAPNILYRPGILVARISGAAIGEAGGIDPITVRLADATPRSHVWRDFDGDRLLDLQLYFDTAGMHVGPATTAVHLIARTPRGRLLHGTDSVVVLPGSIDTSLSDPRGAVLPHATR